MKLPRFTWLGWVCFLTFLSVVIEVCILLIVADWWWYRTFLLACLFPLIYELKVIYKMGIDKQPG